jgi:hypothetical protein
MTALYFFGDSWSAEYSELERLVDSKQLILNKPLESYPTMVGRMLGLPIKNLSKPGSSQASLIHQLLKSDISAGDHAIFSLTAPSRRMYFNDQGQPIDVFAADFKEALNDYDDSWHAALACYTLYKLCQEKLINCYFLSTFNVSYSPDTCHPFWKHIPDSLWLIPKEKCAAQTEFDPEYFNQYKFYKNSDFYDWLSTNNNQVNQCIRPCNEHPNLRGRELIAIKIAQELKNRIN